MKYKNIKINVCALFFFPTFFLFPGMVFGSGATDTATVFTKNLKLGDTDSQVLLLQKALNRDSNTIIATIGTGSSGNETTYFGQKTKTALIKFQNKHYAEILAPNGLIVGTGYFGASTRAIMNTVTTGNKTNDITTTIPSGTVFGLGQAVKIDSISPTHGKNRTVVTIHGSGITPSANRIIAGGQTILNATSTEGKTITFTMEIPPIVSADSGLSVASSTYITENWNTLKTADFPAIKYPIYIVNDNGVSNCVFFTADL